MAVPLHSDTWLFEDDARLDELTAEFANLYKIITELTERVEELENAS